MEKSKRKYKKILIVEDYESIHQVMSENITRKFVNISVEFVLSGEEAIEKIKSGNYDLILLDIDLGEGMMNGLDALKHIKKIKSDQNVYM
ncbi:response regulator, partial [candidate division KSB1 bacterium]